RASVGYVVEGAPRISGPTRPNDPCLRPRTKSYDFTGRWTGAATSRGTSLSISADLTSITRKKFTGDSTLGDSAGNPIACAVAGKNEKAVHLRLKCDDGHDRALAAKLNRQTETLTGSLRLVGKHRRRSHSTFKLTKENGRASCGGSSGT